MTYARSPRRRLAPSFFPIPPCAARVVLDRYLSGGSEFLDHDEPFAAVADALDCRQFVAADTDERSPSLPWRGGSFASNHKGPD
jgi:hypothetical protein